MLRAVESEEKPCDTFKNPSELWMARRLKQLLSEPDTLLLEGGQATFTHAATTCTRKRLPCLQLN